MTTPILTTKLYIPTPRPKMVARPHLINRLNAGSHRKLTLISAPAGFGKTTLVTEWIAECERAVAWVSLDEGDNDFARFVMYVVGALRNIVPGIGEGVLGVVQSQQPPPPESILTVLLNDIATLQDDFILVLDDYHLIDSSVVDGALAFLIEHQPPQMHLVITTREDPQLPLARLRARSQMTELRVADLRFTPEEVANFLNNVMGLDVSAEGIAALEKRTEGWVAGLQLAAISMHGQDDTSRLIESFTGSHHFVLDYLVEEVLQQQPDSVQTFLLKTSILDRLCGSLCDAVLLDADVEGQAALEYFHNANLFLIPLDNERRWYRYHHLFADLLRQRLQQAQTNASELHSRASEWYEAHDLNVEAFRHAAAAGDIARAERLLKGDGVPLHFRGVFTPVLNWLGSLPDAVLDERPALRVMYASALTIGGRMIPRVEENLQAAEAALENAPRTEVNRDLIGHIAAIRALLAAPQYESETMLTQSRRALEYLNPDNLTLRTTVSCIMGLAYQYRGERAAARQAHLDTLPGSRQVDNRVIWVMSLTCLGMLHESDNELHSAKERYEEVLQVVGDPPLPYACEAVLGLGRVYYQWNALDTARKYFEQGLHLARQIENIDTPLECEMWLAHLALLRGDVGGASEMLAAVERSAQRQGYLAKMQKIAAEQVLVLIHQGNLTAAATLADTHDLTLSRARVHLAHSDPSAALQTLDGFRQQAEAKVWQDDQLQAMVLQALAHDANDDSDAALSVLGGALVMAKPAGFVRLFVDEGRKMARLLRVAQAQGVEPDYVQQLLSAFHTTAVPQDTPSPTDPSEVEALSERELEVLQLIAEGLTNQEVASRLYLSLHTVKVHARNIYSKLSVKNRTQAVAAGRATGILPQG